MLLIRNNSIHFTITVTGWAKLMNTEQASVICKCVEPYIKNFETKPQYIKLFHFKSCRKM